MRIPSVLLVIALMTVASLSAGASSGTPVYRLGAGDEVRITVFNNPDLSGQFVLGGDGAISMPLVGEIRAGGLSARELEAAVVNVLKPDFLKNPSVTVEVLNFRPFYILGQVGTPGSYPYKEGITVVNAVALAGGYTPRANTGSVEIERAGGDGKRIKGGPETVVLPGDIIHVPERWF